MPNTNSLPLRPYQQRAKEQIHTEWEQGRLRTLLVLPTGTGKTIVFAAVAEDQVRAGDRVLILAHRGELLEQAADKLQKSTGLGCAVEKAEQSCLASWYRVAVGSVQSLQRPQRLEKFPHNYFSTIIIDEAHHAVTDGYRRILDWFPAAKVLGVTATPDRGDLRNLGEVFDSLAYEYALWRRPSPSGWTSPPWACPAGTMPWASWAVPWTLIWTRLPLRWRTTARGAKPLFFCR